MACPTTSLVALQATARPSTPFSHLYPTLSPSSFCPPSLRLSISNFSPSLKYERPRYKLHCAPAEGAGASEAVLELPNETQEGSVKRKLYVMNVPWTLSTDELKSLFSECGTVEDIEMVKNKKGKSWGYGFVTMASGDEAQAAIDKLHSKEISGRVITVTYAKSGIKPRPVVNTVHKLYVSNLQWKVRSSHLREFFSADFSPTAVKAILETPSGRSAGYGFVSFSTRKEAEDAISSLDGKELLGRPIRLKFCETPNEGQSKKVKEEKPDVDESVTEPDEVEALEEKLD